MKKIGRNDPCFCHSGKKYKHCHLQNKNIRDIPQKYPPVRVEEPKHPFDEITKIPSQLEIIPNIGLNAKYSKQISKIIIQKGLFNLLGWNDEKTEKFSRKLLTHATNKAKRFDPHILRPDLFDDLRNDPKYQKHANSFYWNEIDQRFFQYKCNTHNLICDRICRAIDLFDDHLTCASILRQIIEIVINSIANQMVITVSFIEMKQNLRGIDTKSFSMLLWEDLENFVIALTNWPKKNIKIMSQLSSFESNLLNSKGYKPLEYQPTTHQRFKITKWLAEQYDNKNIYPGIELPTIIEEIESHYRYLCKFIHPTPMMFPVNKTCDFDDKDVITSLKTTFVKLLDLCITLHENLSENHLFYSRRFQDLIENKLRLSRYSESRKVIDLKNEFIGDVMNKYKDLVLKTKQGDVEIVKLGNFNKRTKKFAKRYEKLPDTQKDMVDKYILNLKNG